MDSLRAEVESAPVYFHCDLTDVSELKARVKEAIAALGGVDVLVNNAANDQRHKIEDVTEEYFDRFDRGESEATVLHDPGGAAGDEGGWAGEHHQYVFDFVDDSVDGGAGVRHGKGGDRRADADDGARAWAGGDSRECSAAGGDCDREAEAAGVYAGVQGGDHGEPGIEARHLAGGCGAAGAVSGGG